MAFELPPLPYADDALVPHISAETLAYHHGKHHRAYVDNLNRLTEGTEWADRSLEDIIREADGGIFNTCWQPASTHPSAASRISGTVLPLTP